MTDQHHDPHHGQHQTQQGDERPHPRPPAASPAALASAPPSAAPTGQDAPDLGEHATGDIVIDSALQDLRDAPEDDLDARIAAGQRVHQTLQGRLSHLGGE